MSIESIQINPRINSAFTILNTRFRKDFNKRRPNNQDGYTDIFNINHGTLNKEVTPLEFNIQKAYEDTGLRWYLKTAAKIVFIVPGILFLLGSLFEWETFMTPTQIAHKSLKDALVKYYYSTDVMSSIMSTSKKSQNSKKPITQEATTDDKVRHILSAINSPTQMLNPKERADKIATALLSVIKDKKSTISTINNRGSEFYAFKDLFMINSDATEPLSPEAFVRNWLNLEPINKKT